MAKKSRKELDLAGKVLFIEAYEKGGIDLVSLSKKFGIGKTQAYGFLKDKDLLMKEFQRPSYERKLDRCRYPTI